MGAVALAGLAGGIVLLYILKLKRAKVKVSSTLLWELAVHDYKVDALWQMLRSNLLMFLQIAATVVLFSIFQASKIFWVPLK